MKAEFHDETDLLATLARKNAVLQGINRIFHEALAASSEEALGRLCLAVAEDLTGASFGFMGELNAAGDRLNDLAVSDRGRAAFAATWPDGAPDAAPTDMVVHGLYGRTLRDDCSVIVNDPATHPDRIGTPAGHPGLDSFMGVPLHRDGRLIGMIGLGNRPGGFREVDRLAVEELAPAVVQALFGRRAEIALRESEDIRRMSMELMPAMLWHTDANGGAPVSNGQWSELTGQSAADMAEGGWAAALHPDDAEATLAAFRHAVATGEPLERQLRIRCRDGDSRWFLARQVPLRDEHGTVTRWFGAATDIHELHLLEERQRRLLAELQHRVRSILTAVRLVFAHTVEAGGALEDITDHFRGRLDALARTQAVVTRTANGHVDLENLIRDELLSVGVLDGEAVTITGPDVSLPPAAAEALGLAIHELATNAVKYGALRTPGASLAINWTTDLDCGAAVRLHLIWWEQGVPAVSVSPNRHGFGSQLIRDALPHRLGAETRLTFQGGGVHCTIMLPLAGEGMGR
ncbi:MAG: hypothetical protein DI544_10250 [Sphingomonas taxi]|uniref:histidine kinase n=1 Tax=Sphingomonas taxi TaxID=1549858 RepID=A0A2W5P258_9SPHN|nr:MAG: hypothetical protein DI544_10250 [Sphingomonas taxi]